MSKIKDFITKVETFLNETLKKGSKLKLLVDLESIDGNTIPKESIVDIISMKKNKDNVITIEVEAIDGEVGVIEINKRKQNIFKQVR